MRALTDVELSFVAGGQSAPSGGSGSGSGGSTSGGTSGGSGSSGSTGGSGGSKPGPAETAGSVIDDWLDNPGKNIGGVIDQIQEAIEGVIGTDAVSGAWATGKIGTPEPASGGGSPNP